MMEEEITEDLFVEILAAWRHSEAPSSIVPVNEKIDRAFAKERGRPSIDFCFRDRYARESFFGFECKKLKEGNNGLYHEYVEEGLCRYLECKYCSKGSAGSLIGYIMSGSVSTVVSDLKKLVDEEDAVAAMSQAEPISGFKEHYLSIHTRQKGPSPFSVHHLFFRFD